MDRRRAYLLIIIFLVFFLPILILLFLKTGSTEYVSLPIYGEKTYNELTGDSISHTAPSFELLDYKGKVFNSQLLHGKVYVVHYNPEVCGDSCKMIREQLLRVQNSFVNMPKVTIISLFSEGSVENGLADFALQNEISADRWKLLTVSPSQKKALWEGGYLQSERNLNNLVLVDQEGRIRGIYDATNREEGKRLMDEINLLIKTNGK